jgi:hypothetical protein
VHSTSNGEWYGAIATLDTGSDENWISQELVDRLRLAVHKGLVTRWKTFNGETFASDSTVRATWCGSGAGVSHANLFRVVLDAPFDVLFGRNLILSGDINLSNMASECRPVLITVLPENETVRSISQPENSRLILKKARAEGSEVGKGDGSEEGERGAAQEE